MWGDAIQTLTILDANDFTPLNLTGAICSQIKRMHET